MSVHSQPIESQFTSARRIQESLSSGVEKKALLWLAARTPAGINSDHLTVLGFVAQFLAGVSYALAQWNKYALLAATFFIGLNWLGDSLDGTLARFRNQQRPRYGFYVDHIIDTFGAAFLMAGLAISGYLHSGVAIAMLIVFLMLSIETYLATYTLGHFQLSYWIFGPTELRILLAIGNVTLLYRPTAHILGHAFRLFDVGGVIAVAAMAVMLIVSTIRHTAMLYRQEKIQ
ncbi:MAG TPA: CDP-alcohol phosphatidyltransferase family protein [Terriglobales bacterium]|jgi:phosphatidylglycerophosphate synthase|nr:CDP-alcohol phosphatidyltransferase family protein [Terriglobales bacterium]